VAYSKGIIQHGLSIASGRSLTMKGRSKAATPPLQIPRRSSSFTPLKLEERKRRWWYDKMEWFRQQDVSRGRPVKDDSLYARAVSRMWNIQSEEKRMGVLAGTYDYTGKGLAEGKDY
jgi:hypothetical protein